MAVKNNLLLTLWLIGGVLYAGSTLFLASALFGGIGGNSDGTKVASVTPAQDRQCKPETVASGADPATTAALEMKDKAPTTADSQQQSGASLATAPAKTDPNAQASTASQDPAAPGDEAALRSSEDGELPPWHGEGAGPEGEAGAAAEEVGEGEWAHVVAGTADMRSEPSLSSQMIYALPSGWQVRVVSKVPGWVQVQDANSGTAGWVEASAIAPVRAEDRHRYGGYPDGEPFGEPVEPQRPRGGGEFRDFLRRAFGG